MTKKPPKWAEKAAKQFVDGVHQQELLAKIIAQAHKDAGWEELLGASGRAMRELALLKAPIHKAVVSQLQVAIRKVEENK